MVTDGPSSLLEADIWATSTLKLGWEVGGIFHKGADGTDINGVDADETRELIVTGDDRGSINIFRFPAVDDAH